MHGVITDNTKDMLLKEVFGDKVNESIRNDMLALAGINLYDETTGNIFLLGRKSKDKIEKKSILEFNTLSNTLSTNNIAGFIGKNDTTLTIKSRFAENNKNDYFLHYMLLKVLNINIANLKHNTDYGSSFSFMPYLFNYYFKKALSTGMYKQYMRYEYNDSRVKGCIDFARHIKYNFMDNGRVAYNTREHSYDNNINQLIRHTIEYIKEHKEYSFIFNNKGIKELIKKIEQATPSYSKNSRSNIINKNLKTHVHPYYTEYEPLRKICLKILRHEELRYGTEKNKIYGILFDVSFLWEEYIAIFLKKLGFIHPVNSTGYGAVKILQKMPNWECYPDFYNDKIVIDTKYKKMENMDSVGIKDRYQILSYMYILGLKKGILLHPSAEEKECILVNLNNEKNIILQDCAAGIYHFQIPQNIESMEAFAEHIKISEEKLLLFIEEKYC